MVGAAKRPQITHLAVGIILFGSFPPELRGVAAMHLIPAHVARLANLLLPIALAGGADESQLTHSLIVAERHFWSLSGLGCSTRN